MHFGVQELGKQTMRDERSSEAHVAALQAMLEKLAHGYDRKELVPSKW